MKKILLFLMLGIFFISLASAEGSIGTVKQNDCIDLYQFCPSCSYVNLIAVKYPNVTISTMDLEMTKEGNNFNYNFCLTTELGEHFYTVCGDKDGTEECEQISFEVTPSGFINKLGFYIIILILSFGIIIFGYFIEDSWVVILGAFGLVLVGLFILLNGIDGMKDTAYTYSIAIITIMLGSYFGIKGALEHIDL